MQHRHDVKLVDHDHQLIFSGVDGGLSAIRRGQRFVHFTKSYLWQLTLRDADRGLTVLNNRAQLRFASKVAGKKLIMTWKAGQGALGGILVSVTIRIDAEKSYWNIQVKNKSRYALWEVGFPFIGGLGPLSKDSRQDYLVLPWQWGIIVPDPIRFIATERRQPVFWDGLVRKQHELAYEYPGLYSMQFLAYGSRASNSGIYLGAHDGQAHYKVFGLFGNEKCREVNYGLKQYPEAMTCPGRDYRMPYEAVVSLFDGAWGAAAGIYKAWALQQAWCRNGRISQRKDMPDWVKKMGLWYWNWNYWQKQGELRDVIPALVDLKKRLQVPVAFHWYGWDDKPGDVDYPEYNVTAKARKRLATALRRYRQEGIKIIPYMNGRLWNVDTNSWQREDAGRYACRREGLGKKDGRRYYIEPYCHRVFVPMCPSTKFWQNKVVSKAKEVMDYGVDGIYVDQVSSSFAVLCFADNHGHGVGGNYWYKGYVAMMEQMRQKVRRRHPEAAFTSESVIECFIHVFDAFLGYQCAAFYFNQMFGKDAATIPLFNAVYHGYIPLYSTGTTIQDNDFFYIGTALDICGGIQPSVQGYFADAVNRQEYEPRLRYLGAWVKKHQAIQHLLQDAEWVPTQVKDVPQRWVTINGVAKSVPAILTGAWKAQRGDMVLFAVNHTTQHRRLNCVLDGKILAASGKYRLKEINPDNEDMLVSLSSGNHIVGELAPRSVNVYLIVPGR